MIILLLVFSLFFIAVPLLKLIWKLLGIKITDIIIAELSEFYICICKCSVTTIVKLRE